MYKKMYYTLFNAITTALDQLERGVVPAAVLTLKTAQMEAEDLFLDGGDPEEDGGAGPDSGRTD